jgi:uncharacterized protein (TIGR02246 family)
MTEAEAIVQRQLDAYNRRDLDAFLACYADDACLWRAPGTLTDRGRDALRERYRRRFDGAPALHATIVNRIVFDRFVVDHERVTGVPEGMLEAVVTYEVVAGRIANAWFLVA